MSNLIIRSSLGRRLLVRSQLVWFDIPLIYFRPVGKCRVLIHSVSVTFISTCVSKLYVYFDLVLPVWQINVPRRFGDFVPLPSLISDWFRFFRVGVSFLPLLSLSASHATFLILLHTSLPISLGFIEFITNSHSLFRLSYTPSPVPLFHYPEFLSGNL